MASLSLRVVLSRSFGQIKDAMSAMATRTVRKPSVKDSRKFSCADAFSLNLGTPNAKNSKQDEIRFQERDATPQPFSDIVNSNFSFDDVPSIRTGSSDDTFLPKNVATDIHVWEAMGTSELGHDSECRKIKQDSFSCYVEHSPRTVENDNSGKSILATLTEAPIEVVNLIPESLTISNERSRKDNQETNENTCENEIESMVMSVIQQDGCLLDVSEGTKLKYSTTAGHEPLLTTVFSNEINKLKNPLALLSKLQMMEGVVHQAYLRSAQRRFYDIQTEGNGGNSPLQKLFTFQSRESKGRKVTALCWHNEDLLVVGYAESSSSMDGKLMECDNILSCLRRFSLEEQYCRRFV